MKRKPLKLIPHHRGGYIADIPIDQLLFDPNQPRKYFDQEALNELAESIRSQGLQQLPLVNFAFERDGKPFYYIKAGERRYRAHLILKRDTIQCHIEADVYDGTFDINRKLAQAAENSSREPHTHGEIITVMQEVIEDELRKRGDRTHGAVEVAMGRVAQAFGKSRGWAANYYTLTHLHPDLQAEMDASERSERLNFSVAMALARIPIERQVELLKQANGLKEKGGHSLMYRFILRQAQAIRVSSEGGNSSQRGRRPSDDKAVFMGSVLSMHRVATAFVAERRSSEHNAYMASVVSSMRVIEIDSLLHMLRESMLTLEGIQKVAQERRTVLYEGLRHQ